MTARIAQLVSVAEALCFRRSAHQVNKVEEKATATAVFNPNT